MNIGATIKKYRREKNITQEKFAEYLNVSAQAVSRWETGAAYPDIATIPAIAFFLGISADMLFGIEESRREEQIELYLKEYKRLEVTGEKEKRLELSKAAKKTFPGDFRVLRNYAKDLAASPYRGLNGECVMSEDELQKCFDEVLDICRIVREDCTDDEIRNSMLSLQLMIYRTIGDKPSFEKAVKIANHLSPHFSSRQAELALIYDYNTEEEIVFHQEYTQDLITSLWWEMRIIIYSQCPLDKKIAVCNKALKMYRLMYDNEDYGAEEGMVSQIYEYLAKLYIESGDEESALGALEEYVKHHLVHSDVLDHGFSYTSPLFDHLTLEKDDYIRDFTETPGEILLHCLNRPIYDSIRGTERFQDIIKCLTDRR